jgi:glycosyltransferase involved in cell wall biosynthesis
MRILQINNSDETYTATASGAIATHIWEICRAARDSGFQTTVLTRAAVEPPLSGGTLVFTEGPRRAVNGLARWFQRAERKFLGWREAGHRRHAHRVVEAIRSRGFEKEAFILHNDPELAVVLRNRFPRARLFHHFHNPVECRSRFVQRFRSAVDGVFAVSSYVAEAVRAIYGVETVSVVHNGVDLERFVPAPRPVGGRLTLNFLGRTGIEKAPDLFLRAALKLAQDGFPLRIQLVGANHWGRWEADLFQDELARLCDMLRAAGAEVVQTGHVARAEIPRLLQAADIHVLPSRWEEPCALSLLEGMAAGLAVVASRTGGTAEILGKAGRLFEKDSVTQLTEHLRELLFDHAGRESLARAARQRAMEFTWIDAWQKFRRVVF